MDNLQGSTFDPPFGHAQGRTPAAAARHRAVRKFTADKLARIVRIIPQGLPVLTAATAAAASAAVDLSWHNLPLSHSSFSSSFSLLLSISPPLSLLLLRLLLLPTRARVPLTRFRPSRVLSPSSFRTSSAARSVNARRTVLDAGSRRPTDGERQTEARGMLGEGETRVWRHGCKNDSRSFSDVIKTRDHIAQIT